MYCNYIVDICNVQICLGPVTRPTKTYRFILDKDFGELKSIEINIYKKMKNEDINSCVYALIQLSGHSPKTVKLIFCSHIGLTVEFCVL